MRNLVDNPAVSIVGLLAVLVIYAVGIFLFYFVIRLAVRHGTLDAWKRLPGGPSGARGSDESRGPGRH